MVSSTHELKVLISSFHSLITIESTEEERIRPLLSLVAADMNIEFMEWSNVHGLKSSLKFENQEESLNPVSCLDFLLQHKGESLVWLKDFTREIEGKGVTRALREVVARYSRNRSAVVITGPSINLPEELKPVEVKFNLQFPTRDEYKRAIENVHESLRRSHKVKFALSPEEMTKFLDLLRGMTLQQARQLVARALLSEEGFSAKDFKLIEQKKVQLIKDEGLLEYYPVADNTFELGGLANFKSWLKKIESGFSQEARDMKLPQPRGVLLVGVPGCGKSLAAKYVARSWKMPLLKLDAGRLYNKYIGESERNFRRAMELAESISPSILWIDEIEKSIAVGSGGSDMDGGVSRRILGNFLTWLQEKSAPVFVVATANDLFALPAELMRKGRFDEVFFVDLPNSEERKTIFNIHFGLRKLKIDDEKLAELEKATEGFSGSEIEQVVVGAALSAIQNKTAVRFESLREEIRNTVPLSRSRADYIDKLRARGAEFRPVN